MNKGILFAITACVFWGLLFIVPQFMTQFSPIEVAIGRYLAYGFISLLILFSTFVQGNARYPFSIWTKALFFSLFSSIGYYTWIVIALRYSSPAICALISGISPITITFYGNWKQKEIRFRNLIIPCFLIIAGLIIVNIPHLTTNYEHDFSYSFGIISSFLALFVWSWYAVANARFLRDNPKVISSDWSTLIGVSTFFWAVMITMFLLISGHLHLEKYLLWNDGLNTFLVGSAILGILCSWLGAFLWNKASLHLPISLAGQLMIFETIFGLLYIYLLKNRLPTILELVGMVLMLGATFYGVRLFSPKKSKKNPFPPS